ncbi:holin [Streptomyces sp. NBC_01356]|uniref:holin n=1 Tax=Streptomyces sp. NBC_01356 TaxID=2903836 RepID=UPI002E362C40|nr:holin [Streptomyces sp. NBC_01356]
MRGSAKCADCLGRSRRPRPSSTAQGYGGEHRDRFRAGVLARDRTCVCAETAHGHASPCGARSEHADHHPLSKRELQRRGLDEHHPNYGRGLCPSCHSKATARHQPAGWNDVPPF